MMKHVLQAIIQQPVSTFPTIPFRNYFLSSVIPKIKPKFLPKSIWSQSKLFLFSILFRWLKQSWFPFLHFGHQVLNLYQNFCRPWLRDWIFGACCRCGLWCYVQARVSLGMSSLLRHHCLHYLFVSPHLLDRFYGKGYIQIIGSLTIRVVCPHQSTIV